MATTELDFHLVFANELLKSVKWQPCGSLGFLFEYYHVVNDLYIIREISSESYYFINADSPKDAMRQLMERLKKRIEFVVNDDEAGDNE